MKRRTGLLAAAMALVCLLIQPADIQALSGMSKDSNRKMAGSLTGDGITIGNLSHKGNRNAPKYFSDRINSGLHVENGNMPPSASSSSLEADRFPDTPLRPATPFIKYKITVLLLIGVLLVLAPYALRKRAAMRRTPSG